MFWELKTAAPVEGGMTRLCDRVGGACLAIKTKRDWYLAPSMFAAATEGPLLDNRPGN